MEARYGEPSSLFSVIRYKIVDKHLDTIRKIAKDVYDTLGSGFSEDVYDQAMQVGLRVQHIHYESQKVLELKYLNTCVGEGYPDLVVHFDDKTFVVVELKAVGSKMGAGEEQQLRNYMKILGAQFGLLINFQLPGKKPGKTELEIREVKS